MRSEAEKGYILQGDELQYVEIILGTGEKVFAKSGALMYMEQGIFHEIMENNNIDRRSMWTYVNHDRVERKIAFSASCQGKILPIDLREYDNKIVCQSNTFLCSAQDVSVDILVHKKFGTGQNDDLLTMGILHGDGMVFLNVFGSVIKKTLLINDVLRVDSRCLIAMTEEVDYDIQKIADKKFDEDAKDLLFTSLSGPGVVWLQSAHVKVKDC